MDFLTISRKLPTFKKVPKAPKVAGTSAPKQSVGGKTSGAVPPPSKENSPKKRRPEDPIVDRLPPKKPRQSKPSNKVGEKTRDLEVIPISIAKDKGVYSLDNPLLKTSLLNARVAITDWLFKTNEHIEELEKMPKRLKATQSELKKTFDHLGVIEARLTSSEEETQKLKEALKAKEDEASKCK